jgi:hypothetical protein
VNATLRNRLPNLIIVGVMKCGTTSLHYYLGLHPEIRMSREKELDFFIEERSWNRGVAWYARQFDARGAVRGESSPNYTAAGRFPGVAARMRTVVPEAKLIFMVRDPIERLISHWIHNYAHGRERRAFADVLDDERYLERSMYATQLRPYLEAFPREQILVLDMNDLRVDRLSVLGRVFRFLGVDPSFVSRRFRLELHPTAGKRRKTSAGLWLASSRLDRWIDALPPEVRWPIRELVYRPFSRPMSRPELGPIERTSLIERLRPDVAAFRSLTGLPCGTWTV